MLATFCLSTVPPLIFNKNVYTVNGIISQYMKLSLPYSQKEFERLHIMKKLEVERLNRIHYNVYEQRKLQSEKVLCIVDELFKYINIRSYNKLAKNVCKFGHAEDTAEVCEKRFHNTLANYISNGNCCKSCNSVILNRTKQNYVPD